MLKVKLDLGMVLNLAVKNDHAFAVSITYYSNYRLFRKLFYELEKIRAAELL